MVRLSLPNQGEMPRKKFRPPRTDVPLAIEAVGASLAISFMVRSNRDRVFYRVLLPFLAVANLVFGLATLAGLGLNQWTDEAELAAGAGCCAIAGALLAVGLTRRYLMRSMVRQIAVWRQFSDTFVNWIEESRMPDETVARLHRSLNQVATDARAQRSGLSG